MDLAITKEEVVVLVGEGVCAVKTLTRNHLYCEPPPQQPGPGPHGKKREGSDSLPDFMVSSTCWGPSPGGPSPGGPSLGLYLGAGDPNPGQTQRCRSHRKQLLQAVARDLSLSTWSFIQCPLKVQ